MIIKKLEIKDIKSFCGEFSVSFDEDYKIFAFSGINGSGKSTLLEAIWYTQRVFFYEKNKKDYTVCSELENILNNDNSYIKCHFEKNTTLGGKMTGSIKVCKKNNELHIIKENEKLFNETWGCETPKDIILFVDSNRSLRHSDMKFCSISLENSSETDILRNIIEKPNELFSTMYEKIINDYVYNRVIPAKPDKMVYFRVAQQFFRHLIPHVSISNISSKHMTDQFVILGKNQNDMLYDIRNFSSGEKTLLSLLSLLFLTDKISTIIIDEPENNFHHTLLMKLIKLLEEFCNNGILEEIKSINKKQSYLKKRVNDKYIDELYANMHINNVIIATHSKDLINEIFLYGKNFIVSEKIKDLNEDDVEIKLREIGLSSTDKRVLFVEGDSDQQLLREILNSRAIKIHNLPGAESVISTWKQIQRIKNFLTNIDFVFLIDSDGRRNDIIEELRKTDSDFFDKTFVVLDRHEIENYLLCPSTIEKCISPIIESINGTSIKKEDIKEIIIDAYKKTRDVSIKKISKNRVRERVTSKMSDIFWGNNSFADLTRHDEICGKEKIEQLIPNDFIDNMSEEINTIINNSKAIYNSNLPYDKICKQCDGKAVFDMTCKILGKKIGIMHREVKKTIIRKSSEIKESPLHTITNDILEKFPDYETHRPLS